MKASITSNYGSPDLLEFKEVEKPVPKGNEVLVKVYATTVNRTDTTMLRAIPFPSRIVTGMLRPKKPIPGTEFAGLIEAVGAQVSSFKVRDQVFGFNEGLFGSHAQYMTIAEDKSLVIMPENLTYEQAAACSEGGHYAYNVIKAVAIEEGTRVLVNGATGGIGSAAVQILKYLGAHVTGTCRTQHMDLVQSFGVDTVIDYTKDDFTKMDHKFNFIFDAVGKSTFGACKPLLNPYGIYSSSDLGPWAQNVFYKLMPTIFGTKKFILPIPTDSRGDIIFIRKLIEEGKFKPMIDKVYAFEQIAEAYWYVEKAQKVGNVVIKVNHDEGEIR